MTNDVKLNDSAVVAPLKRKRKKIVSLDRRKARAGWIFVLPFIIGFVVIYLPMIYQSIQISFRGGGVDEEGGMALIIAVVNVDGDLLVTVVGVAHGLQCTLDEEKLVALPAIHVDLIAGDPFMGLQMVDNGIHPSFVLAFTQGPPSLTRTHSL